MSKGARIKLALAALEAVAARAPRLRQTAAQERLTKALDDEAKERDRGSNGNEEDHQGR